MCFIMKIKTKMIIKLEAKNLVLIAYREKKRENNDRNKRISVPLVWYNTVDRSHYLA